MGGLNAGLYIGLSGVRTAQFGLNTTGNNIANVNTEGYSRQAPEVLIKGVVTDQGITMGTGSRVSGILGMRDRIADQTLTRQESRYAFQNSLSLDLSHMEGMLNETDFSGIGQTMSEFFSTLEQASLRPDQTALRQEVLATAQRLADEFNERDRDLFEFQTELDLEIEDIVDRINEITAKIDDVNGRIYSTGQPSQDLLDERYRQINELSKYVAVDVFHLDNNRMQINLKNSNNVLIGEDPNPLSVVRNPANDNLFDVTLQTGSTSYNVTNNLDSGELAAKLQVRDQELAEVRRRLDFLAAGVVTEFNAIHTAAYDLNGNTGARLFDPADPSNVGASYLYKGAASSISLSDDLLVNAADPSLGYDPEALAFGTTAPLPGPTPVVGDNTAALAMLDLRNSTTTIDADEDGTGDTGTFEDYLGDAVTYLGRRARTEEDKRQSQELILDQARARREEVSKVSLDEEAVSLTQFQRAFEASSRFLSVINQLTADIISRLG